ncbi:hypothetical protein EON65_41560 [archaeon]|nr:MAG: hypothetical protein EON65_41560 [archaeon]
MRKNFRTPSKGCPRQPADLPFATTATRLRQLETPLLRVLQVEKISKGEFWKRKLEFCLYVMAIWLRCLTSHLLDSLVSFNPRLRPSRQFFYYPFYLFVRN